MKASGKTTIGKLLADKLNLKFIELDIEIEKTHWDNKKERLSFREIYKRYGGSYFRKLELKTLVKLNNYLKTLSFVLSCGGGTPIGVKNQKVLKNMGTIVWLDVDKHILLKRIAKNGLPAFFPIQKRPDELLKRILKKRNPIYDKISDFKIKVNNDSPQKIVNKIIIGGNFYEKN